MPDAPNETPAAPPPAASPAPAAPPPPAGLDAARIALEQTAQERLRSIPVTTAGAVPKVITPADTPPEVEPVTDLNAAPPTEETPPLAVDDAAAARRDRFTKAADEAKKGRLRREREKVERQRLAQERDEAIRFAQSEAQRRQEAERAAQEAWTLPPEHYLERRGMSHQDIVKAAIDESTPEGKQKALEARIAAHEQAIQQRLQQLDAREKAAAAEKASQDFLVLAKNKDDYPTLARIAKGRPQAVLQEANAIMLETARRNNGVYPSFAKVCEYLEWEWSRALGDEKSKPNEEPPTRNGAPSPQAAAPATERPAGKSQTLTSRAAERATLPKSPGQMTKDEAIEYYAQQLREQASRG